MKGALPHPSYPLIELLLLGIEQFQTREDFKMRTGQEPPVWNPAMPPKYWRDGRPGLPGYVSYAIPVIQDPPGSGRVLVQPITLSRNWAQSVNIHPGAIGAGEPAVETQLPYPIRPLFEDEDLAVGLGGLIVVRNRDLWGQLTAGAGDLGPIKAALDWIKAALTKVGITP